MCAQGGAGALSPEEVMAGFGKTGRNRCADGVDEIDGYTEDIVVAIGIAVHGPAMV